MQPNPIRDWIARRVGKTEAEYEALRKRCDLLHRSRGKACHALKEIAEGRWSREDAMTLYKQLLVDATFRGV